MTTAGKQHPLTIKALLLLGLALFMGLVALVLSPTLARAETYFGSDITEEFKPIPDYRFELVEPFTGFTLQRGEFKVGTDVDYGLFERVMIGTDFMSDVIGAPNFQAKWRFLDWPEHKFALGVRAAFLTRDTALWGSFKDHFDALDARIIRPSISWTNVISQRINLHTYWAMGLGRANVKLSEFGKRRLWETKHPDGDYDTRNTGDNTPTAGDPTTGESSTKNQENTNNSSSLSQRTLQLQAITGLVSDVFQLTGEFSRDNGNKVLLTTRIQQMELERLAASTFLTTLAQQWIWPNFQLRLGIGIQYIELSGRDLDGEKVNAANFLPASDIVFYWRI